MQAGDLNKHGADTGRASPYSMEKFRLIVAAVRLGLLEMARTPLYWILGTIFVLFIIPAVTLLKLKGVEVDGFQFARLLLRPSAVLVFALIYLGWPKSLREKIARHFDARTAVAGIVLIVLFEVFFSIYMTFKMYFPAFVPFYADAWLSEVDLMLHFGRLPWDWLAPVMGNRLTIMFTDVLYTLWLIVKFLVLIWQSFSTKRPETRATYFLTYFMCWTLLGTLIALGFSSSGPCYYHFIQSPLLNPYADQMGWLNEISSSRALGAVSFQQTLWQNYTESNQSIIAGISAFPSLHVAIATLFVLVAWPHSRLLAGIFTAYYFAILLGSVALGWHYAVDGYFSTIAVVLIWTMNAWLVKRFRLWEPVGGAVSPPSGQAAGRPGGYKARPRRKAADAILERQDGPGPSR